MLKEFRAFAMRGNALDLAVGVVIGAAFGTIVNSLVKDVMLQLVASVFGQPDFSAYSVHIRDTAIRLGAFANAVVNFMIVAFALFLFVKAMNRVLTPKGAEPQVEIRECPYCLEAIPKAATRCRACTSDVPA